MNEETWKFEGLELDRRSFSLRREGVLLRLDRKPLELLFMLVESRGAVISHQAALERVWGSDVFVNGEAAIYTAIKKIRQATGDASLIETVSGKGYRLRTKSSPGSEHTGGTPQQTTEPEQRLAILPLVNLSNDPEQSYFSDGLTEELILTVSKLLRGQMSVIARTSVMRCRSLARPVLEIAQELNVQYLLEGSVRRHSGRVRITVKLLRASDSATLWGENFEQPLGDVLSLQSEIALATARAIGLQVSAKALPGAGVEQAKPVFMDAEVHDRYLRARHFLSQRTRPSLQAAMRYFAEVLSIDPGFAPAMAGLAICHALLPITSLMRSHDCFPAAQNMASEALALDSSQADAHIALGLVDFWYRRDWGAAQRHFADAAILNPSDSAPSMFLAHIHSVLGEHAEALQVLGAALRLDPISPIVRTHQGHFLYNAGRSREAIAPLKQVLELNPQFWVAHLMQGKALATPEHAPGAFPGLSSASDQAIASFLLSEQFSAGNTEGMAFRIHTLAASGQKALAEEAMGDMQRIHETVPVPPLHRALASLGTGNREAALELLEEGFAEQDVRLVFLRVESRWRALPETYYQQALSRANLLQDSVEAIL